MTTIYVRKAKEQDVSAIKKLFVKCYGPSYRYRDFYDDYCLKKTVFSDNYLFLVAADEERILGTASVYFDIGSYTDLLGPKVAKLITTADLFKILPLVTASLFFRSRKKVMS